MRIFAILWFLMTVTCSAAPAPDNRMIYAVSPDQIFSSARSVGLRVEERGNGCFGLAGRGCNFDAYLPSGSCFPSKHETKTQETLTLGYGSSRKQVSLAAINEWNRSLGADHISTASLGSDGVAGLQSVLVVEYGVSPRSVIERVRQFVAEIHQFEVYLKKSRP